MVLRTTSLVAAGLCFISAVAAGRRFWQLDFERFRWVSHSQEPTEYPEFVNLQEQISKVGWLGTGLIVLAVALILVALKIL